MHVLLSAHLPHVAPPQSMSVSAPFLMPSLHPADCDVPPVQTPLAQSAAAVHVLPLAQRAQLVEPPQSVSLSPPFLTLSLHAAAAQRLLVHTPVWQSPPTPQILPVAH